MAPKISPRKLNKIITIASQVNQKTGKPACSYKKIGKIVGLSRERVRQHVLKTAGNFRKRGATNKLVLSDGRILPILTPEEIGKMAAKEMNAEYHDYLARIAEKSTRLATIEERGQYGRKKQEKWTNRRKAELSAFLNFLGACSREDKGALLYTRWVKFPAKMRQQFINNNYVRIEKIGDIRIAALTAAGKARFLQLSRLRLGALGGSR